MRNKLKNIFHYFSKYKTKNDNKKTINTNGKSMQSTKYGALSDYIPSNNLSSLLNYYIALLPFNEKYKFKINIEPN